MQNFDNVRIIDASYVETAALNNAKFNTNHPEIIISDIKSPDLYTDEHIPGAVHFDLDIGSYSSEYIKHDLYPPEHFQKYLRLLGVNNGDQLVIYSNGPASGMKFASRAYWTFKMYGFTTVSLLNGGMDVWKAAGGPTDNAVVTPKLGNVNVKSLDNTILAKFEEIPFNNFAETNTVYLDTRIRAQFDGEDPLATNFPGTKAKGSHVTGAINFPMAKVIGPDGFISQQDVDEQISSLGLTSASQVFVGCNTGMQASVIFVALERSGFKAKLYNGSMFELSYRAPELVNATGI
ncbi:Rhodanese domain-containing protein [Caenorhabditis elegans]|uniref:Rhodanese domain-containing protein n=1 Tax=Caenorhabditis elegans TaxID=6239 RepID=Q9XTX2_CAEEL|nr:Rhodanese domain-containing protein [Caenorhabditis elegans]CAB07425.2 Rhodanese domain-containing protein [Caenorhabditis elegans]